MNLMWIVGGFVGVLGIFGTLSFLGMMPALAPIFGVIFDAVFKVIGALLKTRPGVALLTALLTAAIVAPAADLRGRNAVQAKWDAADATAKAAAAARDKEIANQVAEIKADSDAKEKQWIEQQNQLKDAYDAELAKRPASAVCALTPNDVQR